MTARHQDVARARAALLLEQLEPLVRHEIAVAEQRREAAEAETRAMERLCRDVGTATDRLQQARNTNQEGAARAALEQVALRLREKMRARHGR